MTKVVAGARAVMTVAETEVVEMAVVETEVMVFGTMASEMVRGCEMNVLPSAAEM